MKYLLLFNKFLIISSQYLNTCKNNLDCNLNYYCNNNFLCYDCSYIKENLCDSFNNNCCDSNFLTQCTKNPYKCTIDNKNIDNISNFSYYFLIIFFLTMPMYLFTGMYYNKLVFC